ncbi:MAG: ferritin-like domain-containing protein [Bacteroidia bacterium]|nr:ferritin-like domain-containing protein [Bacteroidia bacterium]
MNLFKILQKIGDVKTTGSESQTRLESIFNFGKIGKDIALAAVPLTILASLPKTTSAKSSSAITDVLNFALTLEFLEASYYTQGVASGVIPASDLAIFTQIKKHEISHVAFLQSAINSLGGTPVTSPTFDFTANGAFNPFSVYAEFLALAQAFEDTGVRAYKGQAGNLISNNDVLTAALQIHSVEARHASEVRRLRNKNGLDSTAKGWITGNSRGTLPAATQAIYDGATSEGNTVQGGVDITSITTLSVDAITEAFDEPLTDTETLAIASLFIV